MRDSLRELGRPRWPTSQMQQWALLPPIDRMLTDVAPLQSAGPNEVSFLDNRRYAMALQQTMAGAVIVHPQMQTKQCIAILTTSTYEEWARVSALFHPVPTPRPGIHPSALIDPSPSALIDPSALVDSSAEVGPYAVIEARAEIGPGSHIAFCFRRCGCHHGPRLPHRHSREPQSCVTWLARYIYPGARLRQEGFRLATTKTGFLSIPQLGRVIVEDDVEVGANTPIGRGSTRDTIIGADARIDNLVQIGHNVQLGRCCVIVAQVGLAGSAILLDFVQVGGQAIMAGHLRLGQDSQVGAQAGVIADVPAVSILLSSPAQPRKEFFRQVAALRRMHRRPASASA